SHVLPADDGPFGFDASEHHLSSQFIARLYLLQLKYLLSVTMGGGGKIPYPKEVWSPAGGWYAQPANWRANTAIIGAAMIGIVAATWSLSAEREHRDKMPEPGRFFPSRYWSKQIIEHEREQAAKKDS
ncbi:hypothetical protein AOCH_000360, partial [Aspergillus ochraceoroseus]